MNDSPAPDAFFQREDAEPHRARRRRILAFHPEVRTCFGRNPWTAAVMLGVLALQTLLAVVFGRLGLAAWPWSLLVAFGVGAFANHCMYVVVHEACHHLVFGHRTLNRIVALCADLPNLFPGAAGFSVYHLLHHTQQGDHGTDGDLPSRWEARLVGNRWWAKALWLALMPVVLALRPSRIGVARMLDRWWLLNAALCLGYAAALFHAAGPGALLYLLLSFFFSIGLHPLGGRWIQEHYTTDHTQETASYYGPANWLTLNVGYHNEHHDFPSVPWNRLPRLRALAPEFYALPRIETSWTAVVLRFIFDPRFSLWSRVVRPSQPPG